MNNKILSLFSQYNGMLSQKIAKEAGINPMTLRRLVQSGEIQQIYEGVYMLNNAFPDSFFAIQAKLSKGIFSHETALFLHGMTDLNIGEMDMTFPAGYNRKNLTLDYPVIPHFVKKDVYTLGCTRVATPIGNQVTCYNMERTICDMWLKRTNPDVAVRNAALKSYLAQEDKDLRLLRQYMRVLDVKEELYTAMEVLM